MAVIAHKLLGKKMTRKQFLLLIGLACFSFIGLAPLLKFLHNPEFAKPSQKATKQFGAGRYGG